jgi:hypothetical protein
LKIDSTKALVPFKGFVPSLSRVSGIGFCLDHFPEQHRTGLAFKVSRVDEWAGIYGPDRRIVINPSKAEFVDAYF